MKWTQSLETGDIDTVGELLRQIEQFETEGSVEYVSLEIVADKPINVHSESSSATQSDTESNSKNKYTTDIKQEETSSTDKHVSKENVNTTSKTEPVSVRKWPRIEHEIEHDSDLPISAVTYPDEIQQFSGHKEEEVDRGVQYEARVNGVKEYGAFVTLNGTGYSPNSQYTEVTGLLHESNMIRRGPFDYSKGDTLVVELDDHSEKGLSFRERPLFSVEDARQARHAEIIRLNRLNIDKGEEIRFSKWPADRELKGTVIGIENGSDDPPHPPQITVKTNNSTYTIRPSEIVATVHSEHPPSRSTTPTNSLRDVANITRTDLEKEESTKNESVENGTKPLEHECSCGLTFENPHRLWGHQSSCEEYKAEGQTEENTQETTAEESETGRVLNPVVLDPRYQYTKTAITLYLVDSEELSASELADALKGTNWEVPRSNINTSLETLRDKEAATREQKDVYYYTLTKRGKAGVENALDEMEESIGGAGVH